jgi:predicted  nucleic acid-binding Zn-ribbon protein
MNIRKENCCKKLIGAGSEELCEDGISQIEKAELRRTRLDLIGKEYECDISQLEEELSELKSANAKLEYKLLRSNSQKQPPYILLSIERDHCYAAYAEAESRDKDLPDSEATKLLEVTEQLQTMTRLYEKLQNSMRKLEVENEKLNNENFLLRSEIAYRKKTDLTSNMTMSPRRVSRYSLAALEAELERHQRQEDQLKKALHRSDQYVEKLENELAQLKRVSHLTWKFETPVSEQSTEDLLKANEVLDLGSVDILDSGKVLGMAGRAIEENEFGMLDTSLLSDDRMPVDNVPSDLLDSVSQYSTSPLFGVTSSPPEPLLVDVERQSFSPITNDTSGVQSARAQRRKTQQAHSRKPNYSPVRENSSMELPGHFPVRRQSFRLGSVGSFSSAVGDLSKSKTATVDGSGVKTLKWTL